MPHNLCYKAGSLVALGGGLDQVMPHVCSGFYQLKENMILRLALALASLSKHQSTLPKFSFDSQTFIFLCQGLILALYFPKLYCIFANVTPKKNEII